MDVDMDTAMDAVGSCGHCYASPMRHDVHALAEAAASSPQLRIVQSSHGSFLSPDRLDDPRPPGRPMVGPHVRPQKIDHSLKNRHGDGPRVPPSSNATPQPRTPVHRLPRPSGRLRRQRAIGLQVVDLNGVEMNLAARKLVSDFFTDWRSRTRQNQETKPRVHAAVYVRPMRRGKMQTNIGRCCASLADSVAVPSVWTGAPSP